MLRAPSVEVTQLVRRQVLALFESLVIPLNPERGLARDPKPPLGRKGEQASLDLFQVIRNGGSDGAAEINRHGIADVSPETQK